jgi:hypothetical protein
MVWLAVTDVCVGDECMDCIVACCRKADVQKWLLLSVLFFAMAGKMKIRLHFYSAVRYVRRPLFAVRCHDAGTLHTPVQRHARQTHQPRYFAHIPMGLAQCLE